MAGWTSIFGAVLKGLRPVHIGTNITIGLPSFTHGKGMDLSSFFELTVKSGENTMGVERYCA